MPNPSPWLDLFQIFSWTALGYVALFWLWGWDEWAYKVGKYAVVFLAGAAVGAGVV